MGLIDLDAAAAARAQARREANMFRFRGEDFTLPGELSLDALAAELRGDILRAMRLVLDPPCEHDDVHRNDTCPLELHVAEAALPCACVPPACQPPQWTRFCALKPSLDDVKALSLGLAPLYGLGDQGEASASPGSSSSNGSRSRPTSPGSTASTSRKRSGARSPAKGSPSAG